MIVKKDASEWFWENFHRRGWFSHRHRYLKLKHIPMPHSGGEKAWKACRELQSRACLSRSTLAAMARIIHSHLTIIREADPEDEQWWATYAPTSCVSPLGTIAAAKAYLRIYNDCLGKGYFLTATLPFLLATARESALWLLMLVFRWVLPVAYPLNCFLSNASVDLLTLILLACVSGLASTFAKREYLRQL